MPVILLMASLLTVIGACSAAGTAPRTYTGHAVHAADGQPMANAHVRAIWRSPLPFPDSHEFAETRADRDGRFTLTTHARATLIEAASEDWRVMGLARARSGRAITVRADMVGVLGVNGVISDLGPDTLMRIAEHAVEQPGMKMESLDGYLALGIITPGEHAAIVSRPETFFGPDAPAYFSWGVTRLVIPDAATPIEVVPRQD